MQRSYATDDRCPDHDSDPGRKEPIGFAMKSEEGLHAPAVDSADDQEYARPDGSRDRDRQRKHRVRHPEHTGSHRDGHSEPWNMASKEDDRKDSVACEPRFSSLQSLGRQMGESGNTHLRDAAAEPARYQVEVAGTENHGEDEAQPGCEEALESVLNVGTNVHHKDIARCGERYARLLDV